METHLHAGHNHGFFGEWIEKLIAGIGISDPWDEFIGHIIVDTVNIFLLLVVVMTVVFFLESFIHMDRLRHKLASLKSVWGYALAIVIGMLSPFCSCSVIPVLMGIAAMGVPMPVCLCFYTSASMINLTALISLSSLTGLQFTLIYAVCSLVIVITSSLVLSCLKLDHQIKEYEHNDHHHHHTEHPHTLGQRLRESLWNTWDVFRKSWLYIVLGVVLSSAIMAFLPVNSIVKLVNDNGVLSVTLAAFVGIPVHSDIFSVAPIITLLQDISPAVALTFTWSTMAISVPGVILLGRVLKSKVIVIYTALVTALSFAAGYLSLLFLP